MYTLIVLHFIVGGVFAESHTFWYVLLYFCLQVFSELLLLLLLAYCLFKSVFNLHILVDFLTFLSTTNF